MTIRHLLGIGAFVNLLVATLLVSSEQNATGADWPQYRGPQRDGISGDRGLLQEWPAGGPKLLWRYSEAGLGYAGPAIVGDRLYTAGGRGDSEYVFALDLKTAEGGKPRELWSTRVGPLFTWKGNSWNAGPNVTPTVDGDLIYTLGGFGDLVCVEAATGKERWRVNLPGDLGGAVNPIGGGLEEPTPLGWGYAAAPLVDGDKLICVPGGKKGLLAALDKTTGKVLWRSAEVTDQASYSSPLAVDVGGVRQYIQATNKGIVGVAAADGKRLWSYDRSPAYDDVVIATPVFHDNAVYSSVGFDQGCDLARLIVQGQSIAAEKVYSTKVVQSRDGGIVRVREHLYGYSEKGGWICQEFKTGKIVWSEAEALGRGSLTLADGRLYCCAEKGGVVALVEPSPEGWKEHGRLKLPQESKQRRPSGGLWTHPVIANGRLYIRDQEFVYCYDVKK
ncbi:PQQ-binding-like beta-propeller repeat protein [Fimbriiglobus ruber]|uniref:Putative polyvinylalcohol dehydrogenase n=1 Tax=Fimbriiglobus ruber TaxID=1908690 RepID=A0A225D9Q2_9BACT|nr:PQQ-binding-like beta-propeller repeat protein [Fimbriiglobus ruber]OWK37703.1 putative polyvinylalcohol dehydrogenase [Fimbriiglobus ruber]